MIYIFLTAAAYNDIIFHLRRGRSGSLQAGGVPGAPGQAPAPSDASNPPAAPAVGEEYSYTILFIFSSVKRHETLN